MGHSLENKVIIVTGSSSGIGLAIAKAAVKAGAKIMLHGSRKEQLEAASKTIDGDVSWVCANLTDPNSPAKIVDATIEAYGRVDGLVNNAGIFPRSSIETAEDEHFDKVFTVNTRAPLMLVREVVKDMRKRKQGGSIVNIGSINAWCGGNDLLIYSMSKGALMTMTRNLGDSLSAERIRINQLNVGWTLTEGEMAMQKSLGAPDDWHLNVPIDAAPSGSLLKPEDIASHAIFWLADASAPVTGSVYELEQYPVLGRNKIAG